MQPAGLADGRPYASDLVAVIDETTPALGPGVYYVLTAAVLFDPNRVSAALGGLFADNPGRIRPFHWHSEGLDARNRILRIIIDEGVVAHAHYKSVGRRGQVGARGKLIAQLADDLAHDQVEHLIIESGASVHRVEMRKSRLPS